MAVKFGFGRAIFLGCIAFSAAALPALSRAGEALMAFEARPVLEAVNPPPAVVRSHLPCLELQVIAYKESRFRQFDSNGRPLFGAPSGIGIMQLERPYRSEREVWDWRSNVAAGVALFERKREELRHHFENVRRAHPDASALTPTQFKLALYQYYNGGVYFRWDERARRWERYGDTAYADDALRIERLVEAGAPPADWDGAPSLVRYATRKEDHHLSMAGPISEPRVELLAKN